MLAGRLPFVQDAGALTRRDLAAIVGARWFLPPGLQLSDECRDLLGKLLVADPKQRLRFALYLLVSQATRKVVRAAVRALSHRARSGDIRAVPGPLYDIVVWRSCQTAPHGCAGVG